MQPLLRAQTSWMPAMTPFPRSNTGRRRILRLVIASAFSLFALYYLCGGNAFQVAQYEFNYVPIPIRPERYPVDEDQALHLPRGRVKKIPRIQAEPYPESPREQLVRESRLDEVREEFLHAWNGYKKEAWAKDELRPIAGGYKSPFCGWAATMVDALDTLWIMGLKEEFELSLVQLRNVSFTDTEGCQVNLFETTIRHLGGLLAAYDISGGKYIILVEKAVELGEILYTAFDTPNRMPTPHYIWSSTDPDANNHMPSSSIVLAVLGSLQLEFTRLAQITGNEKYYDAVQRVMNELEKWQDLTSLPGMWPAMVDASKINESILIGTPYSGMTEQYTLGALADSTYEYLPKQYILLGGRMESYKSMYEKFIEVAKERLFFRPMTVGDKDILLSGNVDLIQDESAVLQPVQQHLTCFTGGMLGIAGKIFNRPDDVKVGVKLADGCVWAYRNTVSGIMPETFTAVNCGDKATCKWDAEKWHKSVNDWADKATTTQQINSQRLSPGFAHIGDARFLLRPEAIESVFIMHRITGDSYWAESGWDMFKSIMAHTKTDIAHSAIKNVLDPAPEQVDEMESFWLAETLKYFFLLYSTPDVISLDEYVLNTEAHPLRRPR